MYFLREGGGRVKYSWTLVESCRLYYLFVVRVIIGASVVNGRFALYLGAQRSRVTFYMAVRLSAIRVQRQFSAQSSSTRVLRLP